MVLRSPFPEFKSNIAELRLDSTLMIKSLLFYIYSRLTEKPSRASSDVDVKQDEPSMPTASHLARCGVKFRPCKDAAFRGIFFEKKTTVLYIPNIRVRQGTVRFLHNLLAYEATSRFPHQFYVISFAYFMDCLIDTDEDVRVLAEARVISNALGSHEKLASMWNNLCNSVSCRTTHEDRAIMMHLDKLAKSRCRKWRAAFAEKYWEKQPWLLLSIVTAAILLVLTFLQTIYTIRSAPSH